MIRLAILAGIFSLQTALAFGWEIVADPTQDASISHEENGLIFKLAEINNGVVSAEEEINRVKAKRSQPHKSLTTG